MKSGGVYIDIDSAFMTAGMGADCATDADAMPLYQLPPLHLVWEQRIQVQLVVLSYHEVCARAIDRYIDRMEIGGYNDSRSDRIPLSYFDFMPPMRADV